MNGIAVVTGANRGIGLEVVRQLAVTGYMVVLGSRDAEKGRLAAEGMDGERVIPRRLDVTDPDSIEALRAWIQSEYGVLDVLVNNAAVDYDVDQRAGTADMDRMRRAVETNVYGPWRMARALLPLVRKSSRGRIVNVSSESGSLAGMSGSAPVYSMTKAALNAFTRQLAADLKGDGILVNSICPGWVATEMGGAGGRPVTDGAASVVWAVTIPDDGPTGGFFRDGKPLPW
ncbi:MAG: SDR family oxidoreductase [Spirochaetales bacterium]|nr:SDR family oxidoreductase [Spirochaetales bacterium]